MRYTQIQYRNDTNFITIGDYIKDRQPNIFQELYRGFKLHVKDVTERILAAADVSGVDKHYRSVMQERPRRWD